MLETLTKKTNLPKGDRLQNALTEEEFTILAPREFSSRHLHLFGKSDVMH